MILHCRHCARVTDHRCGAATIADRVAAVSDPPARWCLAWLCDHCGQMNRTASDGPEQVQLFGGKR